MTTPTLLSQFSRILLFVLLLFLGCQSATKEQEPAQEEQSSSQLIKVACVGNSITEGAGLGENTYPKHLGRMLGPEYEVVNYGLGGRTLLKQGDFPYWAEEAFTEAQTYEPDVVIIKLGTNDSKPQNWQYKEEFVSDYVAFIQVFQQLPSSPTVMICYPVPVYEDNWGITASVVEGEMQIMLDTIAAETQVPIIDLFTALENKTDMFPDGVHPDGKGTEVMASTISTAIKEKIALK
ncbi:MAG: GDSL-type esterase/lipase family protein [Bacteroidota bacterium]